MNILLAGAYMDFYISKKKHDSYKTDRGRNSYVWRTLKKYLGSMTGKVVDGVEIRNLDVTSNNFWGDLPSARVNDLGYWDKNRVPLNESVITIRIFQVDLVGVVSDETEAKDCFIQHTDKKFQFTVGNVKIV